jgi:outer membrane immunogenic protein
MKTKVLVALIWLAGLAALASGAAEAGSPVPPSPGVWDWNGPYFGINGGGSWGISRWTSGPLSTGDFNISGGMAGGTLGYDWQRGHLVYGLVGDIDWAGLTGSTASICTPPCGTADSYMATVRARFGYDFGPWLPYITGGAAIGDVKSGFRPPLTGTDSETRLGYAVGLGSEYQLVHGWSWWIEYLYEDLGNANCSVTVCAGPPTSSSTRFATNAVRIGLNRRF